MKFNINIAVLVICFFGSAMYLAIDATIENVTKPMPMPPERLEKTNLTETPQTGGPLYYNPIIFGGPRSVQSAKSRLLGFEQAIKNTMNALIVAVNDMPKAAQLAQELQMLITNYISVAKEELQRQ